MRNTTTETQNLSSLPRSSPAALHESSSPVTPLRSVAQSTDVRPSPPPAPPIAWPSRPSDDQVVLRSILTQVESIAKSLQQIAEIAVTTARTPSSRG